MDDPRLKPLICGYDDWRIPFIGRTVNESFWKKFSRTFYKDGFKEQIRSTWTIDSTCEAENAYDTNSTYHTLTVNFVPGSNPLVIESIIGTRSREWHTTSNWQDHAESRYHERFDPADIPLYEQTLNETTVPAYFGISHDYVLELFKKAKTHRRLLKNAPIYRNEDKTWSLDGLESSLVVKILAYARFFPEFFFAFKYMSSLPPFNQLIDTRKIFAKYIPAVLSSVDLNSFYWGFSKELTREVIWQSAYERLTSQCGVFADLLSMPVKMIRSMIEVQAETRLKAKPEDYCEAPFANYNVRVKYYDASAIPDGTLFYFAWDSLPLGMVTPDGTVYEWAGGLKTGLVDTKTLQYFIQNKKIGSINDKREAVDPDGNVVCRIDYNTGIAEPRDRFTRYSDPKFTLRIDDDGYVLHGQQYKGYVRRAKVTPEVRNEDTSDDCFKLEPFGRNDLEKSDKRLAGLAFFGYVPREDLQRLHKELIAQEKIEPWRIDRPPAMFSRA